MVSNEEIVFKFVKNKKKSAKENTKLPSEISMAERSVTLRLRNRISSIFFKQKKKRPAKKQKHKAKIKIWKIFILKNYRNCEINWASQKVAYEDYSAGLLAEMKRLGSATSDDEVPAEAAEEVRALWPKRVRQSMETSGGDD